MRTMDIGLRQLLFLITAMILMKPAMSMRHLVNWNGKLIPELEKEGLQVTVEINDWMDVLCPYYTGENALTTITEADYLFLYNVTEYDFHSCDTRRGQRVQQCDDPLTERKLTTKFQKTSPSPFGFTFRPGETYYYISKPIRSDSSKGCTENTLKMIVNVEGKGTVFDPDDQSIKFYDEKSRKHHRKNHKNTGRDRETKHHHHHKETLAKTTTTTSPPKNAIYQQKSSRHQHDEPENASYPTSYRCTNTIVITILNIVTTLVLSYR